MLSWKTLLKIYVIPTLLAVEAAQAPAFAQTDVTVLAPVTVDAPKPRRATSVPQPASGARRTAAASRRRTGARTATVPASRPAAAAAAAPLRLGQGGDLGLRLDQPSGAGSRLGLTPLQTPASVSIISGGKIRDQGDKSVNDAESRAVGVSAVPFSGNGNNSLSSRGFYGPNSITQLYDGKQLFNGGGVVAFPVDPWNVDRIEVLSGSSTVLYGTGGVGGAFNVIPREPDPVKTSASAQAWAGSYRTVHGAFDVTGPISPILAYRFDVSENSSSGFVHPYGGSDNLALSGALRFQPTADFVVSLRDDYGNVRPSDYEGTPTAFGQAINALRYTNFNVSDGYIVFRSNYLSVKEAWTPSQNLTFNNDTYLITQYRRYREGATYAFNVATNNVTRSMFRDISGNQEQVGDHGFVKANYGVLGLPNQTLFGFEVNRSTYYRLDNQTGGSTGSSTVNAFNFNNGLFSNTGATPARPQYQATLDQSSVFLENRLNLTPQLAFQAGVRGDHYQPGVTNFLSNTFAGGNYTGPGYQFGLIYNPIPNIALYGRYSIATDPVTSLASESATNIQFALSPAKQIEVGAKGTFLDDRLETTFAFYKIVKNNLLAPTAANSAVLETVGEQSSKGIEGSVAYRIFDNLRVEANGTILQAKFDNFIAAAATGKGTVNLAGYRPQFVPTKTANVLARWNFLPDWQLRGALRFVGNRFSDNTDMYKLPAYSVLDLGLKWNVTKNVDFDVRVLNVTNLSYALSTYAGNGTQIILGDPRTILGTINAKF